MSTNTSTSGAANLRCDDSPLGNAGPRNVISSTYASPEDAALHAEAKRRAQRSMPSLTDEQFSAWLALALSRGATIVLTPDGAYAAYEIENAHTPQPRVSKHQ